ncbi:condensin complex protein MksE [Pseudomonas sp. NPDC077649]|uniref:condensin complex protein MksE n=1 Tax=Pseudomonas sp. NPDC077649 TaxID=3364423 RepID=UPI0037C9F363
MTQAATLYLGRLPHLGELFDLFNAGKHLNRVAEPTLWAELEKEQEQYQALFSSLGFSLRVDGRGFAWFHFDNASSNVSRTTRQLALLFMLLFELKADEGMHLARFSDWRIDRDLLAMLMERGHDLLQAEALNEESLAGLLDRACTYGFAESVTGGWRLLPAVWRYLDHFETLASQQVGDLDESGEVDEFGEVAVEDEAP